VTEWRVIRSSTTILACHDCHCNIATVERERERETVQRYTAVRGRVETEHVEIKDSYD